MKRFLCLISFLSCFLAFSQREIIFEYDEAGNQIYRGERVLYRSRSVVENSIIPNNAEMSAEERVFWENITIGPNPVVHTLYVDINSGLKQNIHQIILYDVFGKPIRVIRNLSSLSNRIEIDMRAYNVGAYYISFHLRNGNIYTSSTLLKH